MKSFLFFLPSFPFFLFFVCAKLVSGLIPSEGMRLYLFFVLPSKPVLEGESASRPELSPEVASSRFPGGGSATTCTVCVFSLSACCDSLSGDNKDKGVSLWYGSPLFGESHSVELPVDHICCGNRSRQ